MKQVGFPVHPHVCGEHTLTELIPGGHIGSSPRVWGTLIESDDGDETARFIPTCVGNTMVSYVGREIRPVHPHVCGEHMMDPFVSMTVDGSSPRVWGTHRKAT